MFESFDTFRVSFFISSPDNHVLTLASTPLTGCETEHGHSFVEVASAVLAHTLPYDQVPFDEGLARKWATFVSSTTFPWKGSLLLCLCKLSVVVFGFQFLFICRLVCLQT
jgi:hypothetical protein